MKARSHQLSLCLLLSVALRCSAFSSLPTATKTNVISLYSLHSPEPLSMFTSRRSTINREQFSDQSSSSSLSTLQGENNNSAFWSKTAGTVLASAAVAALVVPQNAFASDIATSAATVAAGSGAMVEGIAQTGFYQAFTLVFLSEIGDKTFFIAGLLAMKTSKLISYIGSMGALAAMTVLSVLIGQIFHAVPSGFSQGLPLDDIAATLAFAFFGYKTLTEALAIDDDTPSVMDEELADAEEAVGGSATVKQDTPWAQLLSIFTLVFAAEFGDRSFLSTIALSAAQNPVSVGGGAIAAHGVATGIAVGGGAYLAKYVSEKVIGIISGALFLVFAVTTALGIF